MELQGRERDDGEITSDDETSLETDHGNTFEDDIQHEEEERDETTEDDEQNQPDESHRMVANVNYPESRTLVPPDISSP